MKKAFAGILYFCVSAALPLVTYAGTFGNPLAEMQLQKILKGFILAVIYVGTPAIIVLIVWTGLLFVIARGNEALLVKAKKQTIVTLVASLLLFSLWALVQLVGNTVMGLSSAGILLILGVFVLYILVRT